MLPPVVWMTFRCRSSSAFRSQGCRLLFLWSHPPPKRLSSGWVSRHVCTEERAPSPAFLWWNDQEGLDSPASSSVLPTTLWFRDNDVQFFSHSFTRVMDGSKPWTGSPESHLMKDLWGHTWGCNTKLSWGTCTVSHRVRIWGWWNISFEVSEARVNQSSARAV